MVYRPFPSQLYWNGGAPAQEHVTRRARRIGRIFAPGGLTRYRHATGDFSSPERRGFRLARGMAAPTKRQTRENLIRKYPGLSLATDCPGLPVVAGLAASDPRFGDPCPAGYPSELSARRAAGDSAAAVDRGGCLGCVRLPHHDPQQEATELESRRNRTGRQSLFRQVLC
jgi:hypothetical protein